MKTVIVYYSKKNTKKVIDKIAETYEVDLINAETVSEADLSGYDKICFASGIYNGSFHESVLHFAEKNLPEWKKVFFIYTSGFRKEGYTQSIHKICAKKKCRILGNCGALGETNWWRIKYFGWNIKGQPDRGEIMKVIQFYGEMLEKE